MTPARNYAIIEPLKIPGGKSWQREGPQTHLTLEEYITLERKAIPDAGTVRSEYINGEIINMPGASFAHNLITSNIISELHTRLKGGTCAVFASDMRISIPTAKSYFYSDVGVVCENPRFEDDVFDSLLNPIVIVEVLSPSTEAYDRGEKFAYYRQLTSLQEYVLVSQNQIRVDHYRRQERLWIFTDVEKHDEILQLPSIECELPLQEIYARVTFPD